MSADGLPRLTRRSDGKVFRVVLQARSPNGPVSLLADDGPPFEGVATTNDRLLVDFVDSRDGAPSGFDAHIEPGDDEPGMGGAGFERYFIEAHKYGATREGALKHWATVLSSESRATWNAGAVAATVAAKVRASAPNALAEALLRAHCDLRWLAGYCGKGSVALSENAAVGFDHAWERSAQNRQLSGKPLVVPSVACAPSDTDDSMARAHVDASLEIVGGKIRLSSASGGLESLWVTLCTDAGREVVFDPATQQHLSAAVRVTPSQARALADLLTRYADSHKDSR